jgi:asparagine synthase (glutamine-hydrolysing)
MCGISGIINKSSNATVDESELKRINDIIFHRGPDSEGFYFCDNIGFGHRRLSIIDLSALGHQPMRYLDKYCITYNGEIYNYLEIRDELIGKGYHFSSESDTEVILAAYDCWGNSCLEKMNGMWAFAIHDIEKDVIFFARDRFGIKPLYYKNSDDYFVFGSEIKQLLNPNGKNVLNEDILLESMLTHIDNHSEQTYFKDIYSFPASSFMIYNLKTNEMKYDKYYSLKVNTKLESKSEEELIASFTDLLKSAVTLRMRSDVKVGTSLSGGLDSSGISAIGSKEYSMKSKEKFIAINAKSIDADNDESHFAKIVSDALNLDLNVVMPTYEDFVKTIDDVVYTQEEPFGSPSMFMGWHVFQKAKALQCTVMLNGQGADEILLGYERYFTSTLNFNKLFKQIKEILNQNKNSRLSLFSTIAYYLYFRVFWIRKTRLKGKSLVKKKFKQNKYFDTVKKSSESYSSPIKLQHLEVTELQLPHLLRYEDRNSMRHSIETRLPFLDYRLVEFCVSLPLSLKIKEGWTKYILRKSLNDLLPSSIVWRKNKFGFESPEKIWLSKYNNEMLQEIATSKVIDHFCDMKTVLKKFKSMSLKDKWMYFNIARWEKVFGVELN